MFVTVQLQGEATFPATQDSIQSDVSAWIQAVPLTVQAFAITLPDVLTQLSEFQFYRFTYVATLQIAADDNWDADGVTAAVLDAFAAVTGFQPSATKAKSSTVDPGGTPSVATNGWDELLKTLHTDAKIVVVGVLVLAGLAVVFIGRNIRVPV